MSTQTCSTHPGTARVGVRRDLLAPSLGDATIGQTHDEPVNHLDQDS